MCHLLLLLLLSSTLSSPQGRSFGGSSQFSRSSGSRFGQPSILRSSLSSSSSSGSLSITPSSSRFSSSSSGSRFSSSGSSSKSGGCQSGWNAPNYSFEGRRYLVSWRLGCTAFSQPEAAAFCRRSGLTPLSLDSAAEEREFLRLMVRAGQRYLWTGGAVRGGRITWPSGSRRQGVAWSHTGADGRQKPDNRVGNEHCLAVLNNFYNDGVKFHDVSCHHKKAVICE